MKKILLLFSSLLFCCIVEAQNLVPNPSFEDTSACPFFISQINNAVGWSSFKNTPDYFNSCAPYAPGGISVPSNLCGFQPARTGNAYAGLFSKSGNNYREWIGIPLSQLLIIGRRYRISFYVSLGYRPSENIGLATNKLGARFSTISYPSNNQLPLNGYAHLYTDSIINDTLNWVEVTGSFVADSSYQYIVIGNFFSDSLTTMYSADTTLTQSYYYVDDVSVLPLDSTEVIQEINSSNEIKIFPNPFHSTFTLHCPQAIINPVGNSNGVNSQLKIYNSLGEIIRQQIITSTNQQIDLEVGAGIYFLRVGDVVQKLVVY